MVRPVARLSARRARTSMRLRALDARDRIAGRGGGLVPPRRLQFVGEGDFVAVGDEFLSHLVALCGLRPEDRVLDVGCGIGRLARALTGYLSVDGAYAGFDVNADGVEWCRRRYAHFPQFAFVHADVRNARFNPGGAIDPVAYEPDWVIEALRAAGLDLVELHPGTWAGREDGLSFQDVVVARA
jgi:SAM-dependent methyltransferase